MKNRLLFFLFVFSTLQGVSQSFTGNTLRVDYLLTGDAGHTDVILWQLKKEPGWGGPTINLIDAWNSGNFRYSVMDAATGDLLYRKGFSSLFEEFQGTEEAKIHSGAYPMTATFPFPDKPVQFGIERRNPSTGTFEPLFSMNIDPATQCLDEAIDSFPVTPVIVRGDVSDHLDIVFLAEGYRMEEMAKFREDARRMALYFLSVSPFSDHAGLINFRAVECPSRESGVDIPGKPVFRNTLFNSSFGTFGSDRYLTTTDTWAFHDAAANAPYDQIIILNNSPKYGGGGFYNHYCQSTVDNEYSEIVAIHEFGHAFGGLADEYVGGVNYDGMYSLTLEPWEPNITTLISFSSKWATMVSDTIPVPTPRNPVYEDCVGVFEGGGYMAKGIYSPAMTCRMKENSAKGFCPVCRQAIKEKILFYSDQRVDF